MNGANSTGAPDLAAQVDATYREPEAAIAALEIAVQAARHGDVAAIRPQRERFAVLLHRFGASYERRKIGEIRGNLDIALETFHAAGALLAPGENDALRARILYDVGRLYLGRDSGVRFEDIERAIAACEAALHLDATHVPSLLRSQMQATLASAYWSRVRGNRADNLERAIALFEAALQGSGHDRAPLDIASIRNNLAIAYQDRVLGDRSANIETAITLYDKAIETYSAYDLPAKSAMTKNNQANAFGDRIEGRRASNIECAIGLYQEVLRVYTHSTYPLDWAMTQMNLALAFQYRIFGERSNNLERSIAHFEAACEIYTPEAFPEDRARTDINLASALGERIDGNRAENLERAISLLEGAAKTFKLATSPIEWAWTQQNLAALYRNRVKGDPAENLEMAISLYQGALQVRTRAAFPNAWAVTQTNLALAFKHRIRGNAAENLDKAIALFAGTLDVHTRETYPVEWARTQYHLATTYMARSNGDAGCDVDRALAFFDAALTVFTSEHFTLEHLEVSRARGQALLQVARWHAASTSFRAARASFLLLLGEGLDAMEARGLIEAAGGLFACAAYSAAEQRQNKEAFALACEGKARLLATALRIRHLSLAADRMARVHVLRTAIREQLQSLDNLRGTKRADKLDAMSRLRSELAMLVAVEKPADEVKQILAQAGRICTGGCVIVVPVMTTIGGKLFIASRGETPDVVDITIVPQPLLTTQRVGDVLRGDRIGGWLGCFSRDLSWEEHKRRMTLAVEQIGPELWALLVDPLEKALTKLGVAPDAPLIILPAGGLGLLPFALAQDPNSGRRLIDYRDIAFAPSLDSIDGVPYGDQTPALASIINPTGDITYAPIEGAYIAAHFEESMVLDERDAKPSAVLAALKGRSYWHFATHGVFDLAEAQRSALAMADGERLTVGDLLTAGDLGRPRLVVLSACETGLHAIDRAPEEFVGFPGAFMTIGARAVLGTLWPIDDCAAALLTMRFYDGHLKHGLSPARALRLAQLWLANATRDELLVFARDAVKDCYGTPLAAQQLEAGIWAATAGHVRFFYVGGNGSDQAPPDSQQREDGASRPFAHPLFWAGFVLNGQ